MTKPVWERIGFLGGEDKGKMRENQVLRHRNGVTLGEEVREKVLKLVK